jgi:hypothetical protein
LYYIKKMKIERTVLHMPSCWSVCTSPKKFSSKTFFRLEKRCKSEGERKNFFDENVFGEEVHNRPVLACDAS